VNFPERSLRAIVNFTRRAQSSEQHLGKKSPRHSIHHKAVRHLGLRARDINRRNTSSATDARDWWMMICRGGPDEIR
jgi:hypothetical protein